MKREKKVVLITGSSSGIGFKTALTFARKDCVVFATVRNRKSEGAVALEKIAKEESLSLQVVELDITNNQQISFCIEKIIKQTKKINILVNNAGFGFVGPVEVFAPQEIREQFETNVFGTLFVSQAIIPHMRSQKSGRIITVSSINGLVVFPFWGIYASSKFAVEAYMESLRLELAPFGIYTSLIEPGSFLTKFTTNRKMPEKLHSDDIPYTKTMKQFFAAFDGLGEKVSAYPFLARLLNPQHVADKIVSVAFEEKPKLHNIVGLDAHIYYTVKKILPQDMWELIIRKVYHNLHESTT